MAIMRYSASADTTITNAFKSSLSERGTKANMGESDVLEVFSIHAQTSSLTGVASSEKSRILLKFPIDSISTDRTAGNIPASGSVNFFLKLFNTPHANTVPKRATYILKHVTTDWDEGFGLDMNEYSDEGAASWLSASSGSSGHIKWTNPGGDFSDAYIREKLLEKGTENLEFDVSTHVEEWIQGASGGGMANYGVVVQLSSSLESGSQGRSYYTKKFFSRGSEFFFKHPIIEARWNSTTLDDRGKFYASSSLSTGPNNLHTLYLYVTVNGQRQNVPTPDGPANTTAIYVRLYDAKTDGTIITPVGSGSFTSYANVVTGGWVDTGIYSASFALDTSNTTAYDRWYSADASGNPGTCYHTGSFSVSTLKASSNNTKVSYATSLTNLKDSYRQEENARFRLYTRNKNWSPTIYTVAKNTAENLIISDMYYRIVRATDNLEVVKYGTGSLKETKLSYDESGSYFDLDMSLLESGYAYKINFLYKLNNLYYKLPDSFKFRVE